MYRGRRSAQRLGGLLLAGEMRPYGELRRVLQEFRPWPRSGCAVESRRANYEIGIGHMFDFLKKDPFGDALTFGYMYENSGTHGFLHTAFGEHTESVGVMKNFPLPATKRLTGYTWIQTGITSYSGNPRLQDRLDSSLSLGAIIHLSRHSSIWIQESYGKVVTVPWYTTSSIGYTWSW
jgi:hypothetical protein